VREGEEPPSTGLTRRYGPMPLTGAVNYVQVKQARPVPDWLARREERRLGAISTMEGLASISEIFDTSEEGQHTMTDLVLRTLALTIAGLLGVWAKLHGR
jgi:hypothetical protein